MMHSTCGYRKFEFLLGSLCFALGGRKLLHEKRCSSTQELHDTHALFEDLLQFCPYLQKPCRWLPSPPVKVNEYSCKGKYSRCLCLAPLGLNTTPHRSSQFTSGAVYSLGLTFSGPKGKQKLPRFWALGREAVVPSSSFLNSQNSCAFCLSAGSTRATKHALNILVWRSCSAVGLQSIP